jgi:NADPH-dependent ferric siderophore reductase
VREQAEYEAPDEDDRAVIRQEDAQEDSDLETDAELRVNWRVEDEQPRATLDEKLAKIDLSDMQLLNPNLKNFTFDKKKGKWCEIELEVLPYAGPFANCSIL